MWCSSKVYGSYRVGLWKNIKKGWESFLIILDLRWEMAPILDFGLARCGDQTIKYTFPYVYSIARI